MRQIATDSITRVSFLSSGWHQSVFDRFSNEKTNEVCVVIVTNYEIINYFGNKDSTEHSTWLLIFSVS